MSRRLFETFTETFTAFREGVKVPFGQTFPFAGRPGETHSHTYPLGVCVSVCLSAVPVPPANL